MVSHIVRIVLVAALLASASIARRPAIAQSQHSGALLARDADGDALTYAVARAPRRGTLTIDANTGAFVYTPAANFTGTDSFTFRARDASTSSAAATVSITINP